MMFAKRLRDGVRCGDITCSVRIWQRPHVSTGGVYRMPPGHIAIDSIRAITFADVTDGLARRSGFDDVADLSSIAKHGPGDNVYLVEFHYVAPADPG